MVHALVDDALVDDALVDDALVDDVVQNWQHSNRHYADVGH